MTSRTVPFFRPYFPPAKRRRIAAALEDILASGTLMMGPYRDRFEAGFAELCGVQHATTVNSATTALEISLRYFGAEGGEVLVPAASFITDVSAVMFAGARPVLVDIDPQTLAFDLADLERKLTADTKGMIWVHLTGIISHRYREIRSFARKHGLFLIEDAAHAHGAVIDDHVAGSLGDVGVFSFFPTKILTAGTGGMLTTNDAALKRYAEEMRLFGKEAESGEVVHLGNDWFLDEIRACVGYHQLEDLDQQLARRRAIAERYQRALTNEPRLRLLDIGDAHLPSWYHYAVFVDDAVDYDALALRLKEAHGIQTKRIYRPTHHEKVFRHLDDGTLAATEHTLDRSLCLPMYVELADDDVDYVSACLLAEIRAHG